MLVRLAIADTSEQNAQAVTRFGGCARERCYRVSASLALVPCIAVRRAGESRPTDRLEAGNPMARQINCIQRDTRGIAALEYALIAGLIFAAIIGAGRLYGVQLQAALGNIGTSLTIRDAGT